LQFVNVASWEKGYETAARQGCKASTDSANYLLSSTVKVLVRNRIDIDLVKFNHRIEFGLNIFNRISQSIVDYGLSVE
jgi:hypothetical protein